MEYSERFISEFGSRTLINLDHIQEAERDGETVFPVTQLWNSLLGLVVLPKEREADRIPETPMSDLWADGWPRINEQKGRSTTLRELVGHLRNAVSHGGVDFVPDEGGEIAKVRLWNLPSGRWDQPSEKRGWEAVVTVPDLEGLARRIAGTYVEVFAGA
ncbi:MAG: HEPN family nuclease [Acidimicrobiales bacterium]